MHWDTRTLSKVRDEWEGTVICAPFTTNSRGTAILVNNSFEYSLRDSSNSEDGNYSVTEINLHNGLSIVLASIYCPNQDNPDFITSVLETIQKYENPNILIGGDWNSTRCFDLDNTNYVTQNNPKMTRAIYDMIRTLLLSDGRRVYNPTAKKFTWSQGITRKQARLDYFLCNDELLSVTTKFNIETKYRSDHSPISCLLKLSDDNRGPGIWRFINSLLKEKEFITLIKKEIINFKEVYAASPYNPEYIASLSHGFEIMISPILFWETLLATLRGSIINYSKKRKAAKNRQRRTLELKIKEIEEKANSGTVSPAEIAKLSSSNE